MRAAAQPCGSTWQSALDALTALDDHGGIGSDFPSPADLTDVPMDLRTLIRYFADFLRGQNFHCKKVTIASYVSHASKVLFEGGHIADPNVLPSPRFYLPLAGYKREDEEIAPKRMTIKIPVTYPVLLEAKATIIKQFGDICAAMVLACMAAFCLGYALSLRPGEYLRVHPPRSHLPPRQTHH